MRQQRPHNTERTSPCGARLGGGQLHCMTSHAFSENKFPSSDMNTLCCLLLPLLMMARYSLEEERDKPCPPPVLKNGRIKIRGKIVYFECKKKFTRVGQHIAVCLSAGTWSQPVPVCVGHGCPDLGTLPHLTVTKQHEGGVLNFDCPSDMRREGPQTLICDGSNWNAAPPKCLYGQSWECDFEDRGLCGWSQDVSDNFDWTWISGATPTRDTGPEGDHTTGIGHYIYMESSAPQTPGQVTRLISPPFRSDEDLCLRFFYHMKGSDIPEEMGELDVYIRPEGDKGLQDEQVFHQQGNQGAEWIRGDAVLTKRATAYKIVFAATRKTSFSSDIAVDDIRVFNCTDSEFQNSTTDGIPSENLEMGEITIQREIASKEATHVTEAPTALSDALGLEDSSGAAEWSLASNSDSSNGESGDDNTMSNDFTSEMTTIKVVSANSAQEAGSSSNNLQNIFQFRFQFLYFLNLKGS